MHTPANGKGSRLDSTHEQTVDARTHNDKTAEDIAPVEDDSHVSDLLEQEPGSPRMESPGVDEMDDSSRLEHNNDPSESPTRRGHDDDQVSHPDSNHLVRKSIHRKMTTQSQGSRRNQMTYPVDLTTGIQTT